MSDAAAQAEIAADSARTFRPVVEAARTAGWPEAARRLIDAAAGRPGWFDAQPAEMRRIHLDNADTIGLLFSQTPLVPIQAVDLSRLALRTTGTWGSDTTATDRLVSQAAASAIPGATRIEVVATGHLLREVDPDRFARLLTKQLAAAEG